VEALLIDSMTFHDEKRCIDSVLETSPPSNIMTNDFSFAFLSRRYVKSYFTHEERHSLDFLSCFLYFFLSSLNSA
jgi:hypothetical protein